MKKGVLKPATRGLKALLVTLCVISLTTILFNVFKYYTKIQPVFGSPIYKGSEESKGIAFACNIDWGGEYLPDMLKLFNSSDVKATFFITGRWAKENTELVRLISGYGHTIGNHGYSHADHSILDYETNRLEIEKTQYIIRDITGKYPVYFSPPSGAFNKDTVKAAKDLNCEIILWSIDTIDWKRDGVENIIRRVNNKMHGGGILLFHPTDQTLSALETIIRDIRDKGFEIIPLKDIVNTIES